MGFYRKEYRFSVQKQGDYFFLSCSIIKSSIAPTIEGALGCGAFTSRRKLCFSTAIAVVGPKAAIAVVFCLKSGKFTNNDSIPPGLKKTNKSQQTFSKSERSDATVRQRIVLENLILLCSKVDGILSRRISVHGKRKFSDLCFFITSTKSSIVCFPKKILRLR